MSGALSGLVAAGPIGAAAGGVVGAATGAIVGETAGYDKMKEAMTKAVVYTIRATPYNSSKLPNSLVSAWILTI